MYHANCADLPQNIPPTKPRKSIGYNHMVQKTPLWYPLCGNGSLWKKKS